MCHGENGNGKGEVAISEKMELSNWTDPATLRDKTDGELFYIIKNGKGKMPPEGDRVKPTELWIWSVTSGHCRARKVSKSAPRGVYASDCTNMTMKGRLVTC